MRSHFRLLQILIEPRHCLIETIGLAFRFHKHEEPYVEECRIQFAIARIRMRLTPAPPTSLSKGLGIPKD